MKTPQPINTPVVLIIRDGWGQNPYPEHDAFNAVKLAKTPVADRLMNTWPTTLVVTSGEDVGLPSGTMGNSEVGHQNIGAGRIVDQELMRITRAIRDGSFFTKPAFLEAINHAKRTAGKLHLLGLVSDGHVHSDIEHLFALIDLAKRENFPGDRLFIHVITDGRDVGPTTAPTYLKQLEQKIASAQIGRIASVCGRYYAMDRDNRWDRVAQAYALLTNTPQSVRHPALPDGHPHLQTAASALDAVQAYYDHPSEPSRTGDEFILPTRIVNPTAAADQSSGAIESGDSVIFFNFRGDRPRELTKAFVLDDDAWSKVPNGGFERGTPLRDLFFCTMTGYEADLPVSAIAFEKPAKMPHILGEVISHAKLRQFRCAETEKFPHVTFFFNDYRESPFPGETRLLVPSPKDVTTYDQKPEMSAYGVCEGVLARLAADDCEPLIVVNFANGDMVGHTGNLPATIKAIEAVDECVGRIVDATLHRGGSLIVTADHGNAEQMWDPIHNTPHTAHTVFDVPLILIGEAFKNATLRKGGRLADIAPTILAMMGLPQPPEMTGQSLLETTSSSHHTSDSPASTHSETPI